MLLFKLLISEIRDIKAFNFDTIVINNERLNSVCGLLESKVNHNLLYLAFHLIQEIIPDMIFL